MSNKKTKSEKDIKSKGGDVSPIPVPTPSPGKRSCASVNEAQNALLSRRCAKKVNLLSCRCSGCETDGKYPVIISPNDASLLNTAYNGSGGFLTSGNDLHWEIGLGNATGPGSVSSWSPASVYYNTAWVASPFGNANWLGNNDASYVHVYFRYKFNLGSSVNLSTFALTMDFYADDQVVEIYVNNVKQSTLPNGSGVLPGGSYTPKSAARITLDNSWIRCGNEIIVHVWSMGGPPMGLLVQNAVKVNPDDNACDCHCDCVEVKLPDIHPCISVTWGDSPCDCLETDDVEVACITVCNCYSNVTFNNLSIGQILVTDMAGNPVPNLPDGTPSVQIIPSGPICFGNIGPCTDKNHPSCVSRELVIYTRGAVGKNYRLVFNAICFSVCHEFQSEQCFIMNLCQD